MRNRIVQDDKHVQEWLSTRLLLFHAKSFCQCQEKPRNEPLAVLQCQAAVVVQVLLQVSKRSLDLVIRVWHSFALFLLIGEEIW